MKTGKKLCLCFFVQRVAAKWPSVPVVYVWQILCTSTNQNSVWRKYVSILSILMYKVKVGAGV